MGRRIKALLLISFLVSSLFGLASDDDGAHAEKKEIANIVIANGSSDVDNGRFYTPSKAMVEAGTTVKWVNLDDDSHTVTDGTVDSLWGEIFDSGVLRHGTYYTYTFTEPGTYPYLCAFHPWMSGVVIVEGVEEEDDDDLPGQVTNTGLSVVQKLSVFIRSDRQTYSEGETVKLDVDILGAGNEPADPDGIDAELIALGDPAAHRNEEATAVDADRVDVGRYLVSLAGLHSGNYNLSVEASKDGFKSGYSMLTIHIEASVAANPEELVPSISLEIEETDYRAGDVVTVHGEVSNSVQPASVALQALDPEDRLHTRGQLELKSDGIFEWVFRVPESTEEGRWTVRADYMGASATVSFEVTRPVEAVVEEPAPKVNPPDDEPPSSTPVTTANRNEKVTIASPMITDQTREELPVAVPGQQVTIESEIRNNLDAEQTFIYLVQVKDSSGVVIKLDAVEGVIPAATPFHVGITWIPDSQGRYTGEVFVWQSLQEPVPLSMHPQTIDIVVRK